MNTDEQLIDAVRDYPCLYNTKIADFKVQLTKENAWTAISESLERTGEYNATSCIKASMVRTMSLKVAHWFMYFVRVSLNCNGRCKEKMEDA